MTYVSGITEQLDRLIPGNDPDLLRLYGLLVLTTGEATTLENIHDAWALWRQATIPGHPAIIPFAELPPDIQALDGKYAEAVREVARRSGPVPDIRDGDGNIPGIDYEVDRSDLEYPAAK